MRRRTGQLGQDPTARIECHRVDNRFVPLRLCDLADALVDDCAAADRDTCRRFVEALTAVIEQEAAAFERELVDQYSFFNPDRDTLPLASDTAARTPAGYAALSATLNYLLDKANFERLDDVEVDRVLRVACSYGVRVQLDPSQIDDFAIFVRGQGQIQRTRRSWRAPWNGRLFPLQVYRRLVVIARLKNDPHVLLKVFKDIPDEDVEALLPHARVTMTWVDRLFMFGGGAGAVGSTGMQVVKILSAGILAVSRLLWVVLFGMAVLLWRTFSGYRSAHNRRDSQRTRHLYYQNVANNVGALHMLVSMIAQEEAKEALLAWFMCAPGQPLVSSGEELGSRVETYLKERFRVDVDFDWPDAVRTLARLELWRDPERLLVLPPSEAIARLNEHWTARHSESYHRTQCIAPAKPTTPAGGVLR